jgi:hypothetical protein
MGKIDSRNRHQEKRRIRIGIWLKGERKEQNGSAWKGMVVGISARRFYPGYSLPYALLFS